MNYAAMSKQQLKIIFNAKQILNNAWLWLILSHFEKN